MPPLPPDPPLLKAPRPPPFPPAAFRMLDPKTESVPLPPFVPAALPLPPPPPAPPAPTVTVYSVQGKTGSEAV